MTREQTVKRLVIVGAGQAGLAVAARLRGQGFAGAITILGEEPFLPYQRPPLTKKYLTGELDAERLSLRAESFYRDQEIAVRTGIRVAGIDRVSRRVDANGCAITYDCLVLTTGARPRTLPAHMGGELDRVYSMRSLADADAMAPEFISGRRVVIIGGGYVGLEAAAVAASRGLLVTLVEASNRILHRVAAPQTSDCFRALHERHGVTLIEGAGLDKLLGDHTVAGARLLDGREIAADFVLVGVGVQPNTELAEQSGLRTDNGIEVDAFGRTSDPAVFAAGDCCSFPYKGRRIRLESVPNAIAQAEAVADVILGRGGAYVPDIWFWSDQYDVKMQIAGLNTGYDTVIERRDGDARSFWYFQNERLLAVDALNDARSFMTARRWLKAGLSPRPDEIAAPGSPLSALSAA